MKTLHISTLLSFTLFATLAFSNPSAWSEIDALLEDNEVEQAKTKIENLADDNKGRKLYYQGRMELADGEEKQAIKLIKKAVKQDKNNPDYYAWLGMSYGARALTAGLFGRASAAGNSKKSFIQALEYNPDHITALQGLSVFYAQAPGIVGGNKDKALELAQHLFSVDFDQGSGALVQAYSAREEFDLALQTADLWIQKGKEKLKAQAYTSKISLFARQQEWDKSFEVTNDWSRDFPSNSRHLYIAGRLAVFSEKHLEYGLTSLQEYLTKADHDKDFSPERTHFAIGQVHEKLQQKTAAKTAYEAALAFEPEYEPAKQALKNVL